MGKNLKELSARAAGSRRWKPDGKPITLESNDFGRGFPSEESIAGQAPKNSERYQLGKRQMVTIPSQCEFGSDSHVYYWPIQYYRRAK